MGQAPPSSLITGPKILQSKISVKTKNIPLSSDWEPYKSFSSAEFTSDEDTKVIGLIKFETAQNDYDADDSTPPL